MDAAELDRLIAAAEAAADVAGAAIRPYFRQPFEVQLKADRTPVTMADRSAEAAMRAVLTERCPEDGILGEEFGLKQAQSRRVWVLDPIDGTRAFLTGRPIFGTLIGLLEDGQPLLGVIDQPITQERWVGARGRRTTFRGPFGGRVGCRLCPALAAAELAATSPAMFQGALMPRFQRLAQAVQRLSWGGDCYNYGLLALGHIDVIAEADLKIWDWVPLVPIVEGAGGCLTDWQGNALSPESKGEVLAVGNPRLLGPAVDLLK